MRFFLTLHIGAPIILVMNIQFTISALRGAGLTQAQIGGEIGVSQSTISEMESGKCGIVNPSYKLVTGLHALAIKYGVKTERPLPTRRARRKVSAASP
jgi:transcriptional regulator with XRE-family HTH domain